MPKRSKYHYQHVLQRFTESAGWTDAGTFETRRECLRAMRDLQDFHGWECRCIQRRTRKQE